MCKIKEEEGPFNCALSSLSGIGEELQMWPLHILLNSYTRKNINRIKK